MVAVLKPGDLVQHKEGALGVMMVSHRQYKYESGEITWICNTEGSESLFVSVEESELRPLSPIETISAVDLRFPSLVERAAQYLLAHNAVYHCDLAEALGADYDELFDAMWMDEECRFCGLGGMGGPPGMSGEPEWWLRESEGVSE